MPVIVIERALSALTEKENRRVKQQIGDHGGWMAPTIPTDEVSCSASVIYLILQLKFQ